MLGRPREDQPIVLASAAVVVGSDPSTLPIHYGPVGDRGADQSVRLDDVAALATS